VSLADGQRFRYDKLIVATGADTHATEVPGPTEHAATIWPTGSMLDVRRRFADVRDRALRGEHQRVLFLVPPLQQVLRPLYEIVFMLETWLRRAGAREHVDVAWSTYEAGFIQAFGSRLQTLGFAVSARFAAGDPFHAGRVWDVMDVGLKAMSGVLAD